MYKIQNTVAREKCLFFLLLTSLELDRALPDITSGLEVWQIWLSGPVWSWLILSGQETHIPSPVKCFSL